MTNARWTTAVVASTLLLAGCSGAGSLASDLTATVDASAGGSFALADVAGVEGSGFLVVCPYESTDSIEERLGFAWDGAPDYSLADDRQTIAVIDAGEVSSSVELARAEVDFCSAGSWAVLPLDTRLAVSDSGDPVRVTA